MKKILTKSRRPRINFSESQLEVLNSAYKDGLTSAKQSTEIDQLAETLGIPSIRIKNWIGNRRKKEKGPQPVAEKERKEVLKPTSYNLFCREQSIGKSASNSFKEWALKWNSLDSQEKKKYGERASLERSHPEKYGNIDPEVMKKRQFKRISNACDILSSLGVEAGGIAVDTVEKYESVFGSAIGIQYFNRQAVRSDYTSLVIGPSKSAVPKTEDDREILRQRIRKLFRDVWATASGKKEKVPYRDIKENIVKINVSGLPTDVIFKNPSCYGGKTMANILENEKEIVVDILSDGRKERGRNSIVATDKRENSSVTAVTPQNDDISICEARENSSVTVTPQNDDVSICEARENSFVMAVTPQNDDVSICEARENSSVTVTTENDDVSVCEARENSSVTAVTPQNDDVSICEARENSSVTAVTPQNDDVSICEARENSSVTTVTTQNDDVSVCEASTASGVNDNKKKTSKRKSEDNDIYNIDEIIKKRVVRGQNQLLVKWTGFSEPQWITESSIIIE